MIPRLVRLIPYSYLSKFEVFKKMAVLCKRERETVRKSSFLIKGKATIKFSSIINIEPIAIVLEFSI